MAVGWSPEDAVQEQIDATVESELQLVRRQLSGGISLNYCDECGDKISEARRQAMPGVRYCVKCQSEFEKLQKKATLYN